VTVLPKGRLAAVFGKFGLNTIFLLDADGSNYSTPVTASGAGHPAWLPGTTSLVYDQSDGTRQALYVLGADGTAKPFLTGVPATMTRQSDPAPSTNGSWVYFTATDSRCAATDCIARSASDGSSVELVVTTPSGEPSPSPDGSKVAYADESGSGTIRVLDVATHTASAWSAAGSSPAWSPDGSRIAYVTAAHTVSFIAPDGTAPRSLPSSVSAEVIHGWSPDGKWLIVQNAGASALVDAATGASLPLQYSKQMIVTSMK
jgi:Periplasmic component of the Tol biopolymer transport system